MATQESLLSTVQSSVVFMEKKDGIRFCIDFSVLSVVTVSHTYPVFKINELDSLSGQVWVTVLDSRATYWSVELAPKDFGIF